MKTDKINYDKAIKDHRDFIKRTRATDVSSPDRSGQLYDPHFDQIVNKAEELADLLEEALPALDLPEHVDRHLIVPSLRAIAEAETPSVPNSKAAIKMHRLALFFKLFRCWTGNNPKAEEFIKYCHKAVNEAGDHLEERVVRDMIMALPRDLFTRS